jgi:hypothetical protein
VEGALSDGSAPARTRDGAYFSATVVAMARMRFRPLMVKRSIIEQKFYVIAVWRVPGSSRRAYHAREAGSREGWLVSHKLGWTAAALTGAWFASRPDP